MDAVFTTLLGSLVAVTYLAPVSLEAHLFLVGDVVFGGGERVPLLAPLYLVPVVLAVATYLFRDVLRLAYVVLYGATRRPIPAEDKALFVRVLVTTAIAGSISVLLFDIWYALARDPVIVAWGLVAGAVVLIVSEWYGRRKEESSLPTLRGAFGIGLSELLALVPGIGRMTAFLASAVSAGVARKEAYRFSLLVLFPTTLIAYGRLMAESATGEMLEVPILFLLISSALTFVVSLFVLHILAGTVARSLTRFALYRLVLGALMLWFLV